MKPFVEKKNDLKAQNIKQELKNTKTGKCKHHKKKKKKKKLPGNRSREDHTAADFARQAKRKKKKKANITKPYISQAQKETLQGNLQKKPKKKTKRPTLPDWLFLRPKVR